MLAFIDDGGDGIDDRAKADYDWSGWQHNYDDHRQMYFWFNPATGETQWIHQ